MKKIILFSLLVILIGGGIFAWLALGSGTAFADNTKFIIIEEGQTDKASVVDLLEKKYIIKHGTVFSILASRLHVWDKLKPGKYEIHKGESLLDIARMLRNNHQAQIKLIINKLRTKEDLAKLIGKSFASDSTQVMTFLESNDSLKQFNVDSNRVFSIIIPDTYTFYWNTSLTKILQKLQDASTAFWSKNSRIEKATAEGFSPIQAYTLASIVEEETNYDSDRSKIASVYINRLKKNMPMQACPSIKFAMRDFALTRIYEKYLFNPSPYNTYRNKGLPPGPICTPSPKCIDLVLNAPSTNYLFFVAKADFSGYHHFSDNFAEHSKYAKEYQAALDIWMAKKQQQTQAP
jgi:UPF0755 protein